MSSASYITPKNPISREEWLWFCSEHSIEYSPETVGRNVFYYGGKTGVEITFGSSDFQTNKIPFTASKIIVSSFFMQNIVDIAKISNYIVKRWKCSRISDPEVTLAIKSLKKSKK